ncbi:glycosyltransferase family 4 protein [Natrarchaeobius chitinivorans]|uniref:Glycosyltransferase n=1 Tax=Natrarchaeobius chitinivorans TaxID=1679083 RepID=A0A3N6PGX9_NATCH|nr:glycosyltransferase family 4 protein [Natrarchaeobius chitinivorans]RQG97105.1 glycosyltransferase [Natrarchaeobius chitinivorans]
MHVLALTTNDDAPFMNEQMRIMERRGVSFSTLSVSGDGRAGHSRGPTDYLRFLPSVVRESANGYDLVHAHYGLTAPMAVAQLRKPVVLSLWGSDLYGPVEPISRACAPLCDEVVVMSEEMRRYLGRDCTVVPDGVDLEKFQPGSQSRAREAVGWSDDEYQVLFPYTPKRTVKNYPRARRIVNAVNGLVDRPVRLHTVYGVDHDAVPDYMNAADALLLTSDSEGSPNSVKEALACNLPVVSTDVGDVSDRLEGVSPSVVASDDEKLIEGLRTILECGERSNGREAAREISIDRTTSRMIEVYERVV